MQGNEKAMEANVASCTTCSWQMEAINKESHISEIELLFGLHSCLGLLLLLFLSFPCSFNIWPLTKVAKGEKDIACFTITLECCFDN